MCSGHNYPENPRPYSSCPVLLQSLAVERVLEPNDTIYINILSERVFPVNLMDLGARNYVRVVFCYFCV